MGKLCEAVAVLLSIFSFSISIGLVIASLLTEHWVYATISNDRDLPEGRSHVSSGIFTGIREVDWGLGSKTVSFYVFSELQTGISFFSRIPWILMIFFCVLGVFWAVVGITTGIVSFFAKNEESVAGELGIFLWSLLASLCLAAAGIIFIVQFQSTLKQNLLLPEQVLGGFSTAGKASIDYSFYLLLAAIGVLQTPPLFVLLSKSCKKEPPIQKQPSFDPTALLY